MQRSRSPDELSPLGFEDKWVSVFSTFEEQRMTKRKLLHSDHTRPDGRIIFKAGVSMEFSIFARTLDEAETLWRRICADSVRQMQEYGAVPMDQWPEHDGAKINPATVRHGSFECNVERIIPPN